MRNRDRNGTDFDFGCNDPSWKETADNLSPWEKVFESSEGDYLAHPEKYEDQEESEELKHLVDLTVSWCKKQIRYITETVRKANRSMLPSANGQSRPSGQKTKRDGPPFLSKEHLTRQPKDAKILSVKSDPENKFGAAISVKIAMDGERYLWTVRIKGNPNYRLMLEKFGNDENDWVNQPIMLNQEVDEHDEKWYPRVSFPAGKPTKKS